MAEKRITELLNAPLDRAFVREREQSGRTFSYVEAWHCIAEANRIFGHDEWTRETVEMNLVQQDKNERGNNVVGYVCKVRVNALGVTREGTGFGQGIDKDLGRAHESAVKEAESDAMKRALMTFGNPFGLALYDKDQANVKEASDPVKDMGDWLVSIGLGKDDFKAFKNLLMGTPAGWVEIALAAKEEGVTNYETLIEFVAGLNLTKKEAK